MGHKAPTTQLYLKIPFSISLVILRVAAFVADLAALFRVVELFFLEDVDLEPVLPFVIFLATCVPMLLAKLVATAPIIVPKIVRVIDLFLPDCFSFLAFSFSSASLSASSAASFSAISASFEPFHNARSALRMHFRGQKTYRKPLYWKVPYY